MEWERGQTVFQEIDWIFYGTEDTRYRSRQKELQILRHCPKHYQFIALINSELYISCVQNLTHFLFCFFFTGHVNSCHKGFYPHSTSQKSAPVLYCSWKFELVSYPWESLTRLKTFSGDFHAQPMSWTHLILSPTSENNDRQESRAWGNGAMHMEDDVDDELGEISAHLYFELVGLIITMLSGWFGVCYGMDAKNVKLTHDSTSKLMVW